MDLHLQGVHVLVTGANGGIGLETTRLFLEQGANVTAHYRSSGDALLPLLERYGPTRLHREHAELASEEEVINCFRQTEGSGFGFVEIAVINHGRYESEDVSLKDMSLAQWESTFSSNLTSTFLVARGYLGGLENGVRNAAGTEDRFGDRAAIILVGSTAGKYGEAGHADYAASKSAMMYGLTLTLKNEIVKIAPRARVNCVAPGWTRTPMAFAALQNPRTVDRVLATMALRKVAEPEDVASQIVLLASARVSGHVSGQVLMVEGGMEGRLLNIPSDI
ncbi:NAD-P-binding protein [Artomyces pyxidatus]|uniref:NAD-P-binding protein n=1 Tax=Artomyces pyxidatus TaxID=48021 RepID=A0ACB8SXX3_9AGAM|nr:NAD-P-binding protein [Artomyces pyxidatus]